MKAKSSREYFESLAANCNDFISYEDALVFVVARNCWAFIIEHGTNTNVEAILADLKMRGFQIVYAMEQYDGFSACSPNEIFVSNSIMTFDFYADIR